jgi:hypothetical protein
MKVFLEKAQYICVEARVVPLVPVNGGSRIILAHIDAGGGGGS